MTGRTLGPYRIGDRLGAGGMGEVFRARDTRLDRDVAIKVLPEGLAADPDRLARFEREARILAALSHPSIAAIYGIEDSMAIKALVLELVEGPTLEDRLRTGPLPLSEALPIARQIADALEAAHEKGIVHRDLKPSNIKVDANGTVKVLDFGLAKAFDSKPASSEQSPTLTAGTHVGVILGTAAYMSPEQARGAAVDRRSDIWAFGLVVHEMLTGRQMFAGQTLSDTLAAVLRADIDLAALPDDTPDALRRLLARCLERDPRRRLRDIGDARLEIDTAMSADSSAPGQQGARARPAVLIRWLPWSIAIAATAVAGTALWRGPRSGEIAIPAARLTLDLPSGAALDTGLGHRLALSPDGTRIAFAATVRGNRSLFIRTLDQTAAVPVTDTDGAMQPFFSPDSRSVGFFARGSLWRVAVDGGAPVAICPAGSDPRGATWGRDGTIVFVGSQIEGLKRVAASGGTAAPLTALDKARDERSHRWPSFVPGTDSLLFNVEIGAESFDHARIEVLDVASGRRQLLYTGGAAPQYSAGRVLFVRAGTLYALPFDPARAAVSGAPAPVVAGVESDARNGGSQFAVSDAALAYLTGTGTGANGVLVSVDREGRQHSFLNRLARYTALRFSPDGRRIAMQVGDVGREDIWLADAASGALTRLTFDERSDTAPVWSPDGRRLVYATNPGGVWQLAIRNADGSGTPTMVHQAPPGVDAYPTAWSADGKTILFQQPAPPSTSYDVWALDVATRRAAPLVQTPANDVGGVFSPDGRYVAYASEATGSSEVYVRPAAGRGQWQISVDGGQQPIWTRSGREIVFRRPDSPADEWVAVSVESPKDGFRASTPQPLFRGRFGNDTLLPAWSVAPDGSRFVILQQPDAVAASASRIDMFLGWTAAPH